MVLKHWGKPCRYCDLTMEELGTAGHDECQHTHPGGDQVEAFLPLECTIDPVDSYSLKFCLNKEGGGEPPCKTDPDDLR